MGRRRETTEELIARWDRERREREARAIEAVLQSLACALFEAAVGLPCVPAVGACRVNPDGSLVPYATAVVAGDRPDQAGATVLRLARLVREAGEPEGAVRVHVLGPCRVEAVARHLRVPHVAVCDLLFERADGSFWCPAI